jgi:hypothetical protein
MAMGRIPVAIIGRIVFERLGRRAGTDRGHRGRRTPSGRRAAIHRDECNYRHSDQNHHAKDDIPKIPFRLREGRADNGLRNRRVSAAAMFVFFTAPAGTGRVARRLGGVLGHIAATRFQKKHRSGLRETPSSQAPAIAQFNFCRPVASTLWSAATRPALWHPRPRVLAIVPTLVRAVPAEARIMAFDFGAARAALIIMSIVPAVERRGAGAKWIVRRSNMFFRGMPSLGIAGSIGRGNGRG